MTMLAESAQIKLNSCGPSGDCSAVTVTEPGGLEKQAVWITGVAILWISIVLQAVLGFLQDHAYKTWGRDTAECMFYVHLVSIPFFSTFASNVLTHYSVWTNATPIAFQFLGLNISWMWVYILVNVVSQYLCIQGVYLAIGAAGPLTGTLLLTIRKFISLILSIIYFANPFTGRHWLGTILVFGGVVVYSGKINAETLLEKFRRRDKQPENKGDI